MSDASNALTVSGLIGAAAGGLTGIVTSSIVTAYIDSRFSSVADYNRQIDGISAKLESVRDAALRYWTSDHYLPYEATVIITARTEIYGLVANAHRAQQKIFVVDDFRVQLNSYYRIITGGNFGAQNNHTRNEAIPLSATRYYSDCQSYIQSCRRKKSLKDLFPGSKVR